jgi:hypothetical protein
MPASTIFPSRSPSGSISGTHPLRARPITPGFRIWDFSKPLANVVRVRAAKRASKTTDPDAARPSGLHLIRWPLTAGCGKHRKPDIGLSARTRCDQRCPGFRSMERCQESPSADEGRRDAGLRAAPRTMRGCAAGDLRMLERSSGHANRRGSSAIFQMQYKSALLRLLLN